MEKQTFNPPTPKASMWQALTRLAIAPLSGAKEEYPTPPLSAEQAIDKIDT
jgi:hypothetical protein